MKKFIVIAAVLFTAIFVGIRDFIIPTIEKKMETEKIENYLKNQEERFSGKPEPGIDSTSID